MARQPDQPTPDRSRGRVVFEQVCQQCHKLFGEGGEVGPEITGSQRNNLDYVLNNIVDPNSTVGKDFQAWNVFTIDGQTHNGLITRETPQSIVLHTATKIVSIPTAEIEERQKTALSMMPEGLLPLLQDSQVLDLVKYLQTTKQVDLPK